MATIKFENGVRNARVFDAKEEGWSETISLTIDGEIDGYTFNEETGEKELTKVNQISVFVPEVIKALSVNPDLAAFLTAKKKEERLLILPVLLAGAKMKHTSEHIEAEKKMLREIESISVSDVMMSRIQKALDQLFGF